MTMRDERLSSSSNYLRHYPSTPHLETYSKGDADEMVSLSPANAHRSFKAAAHPGSVTMMSGAASNANLLAPSYMPKTTFSTFMQKSRVPPAGEGNLCDPGAGGSSSFRAQNCGSLYRGSHVNSQPSRYQDDPNPYKVSTIDEFRIKVNDPFVPSKSMSQRSGSHMFSFYKDKDQDGNEADEEEEDHLRERFSQLATGSLDRRGQSLYEEATRGHYQGSSANNNNNNSNMNGYKLHRSSTLKSSGSGDVPVVLGRRTHHRSGSASVSASSTGTGDIEIEGDFMIPEPDYEGFHHPNHLHRNDDYEDERVRSSNASVEQSRSNTLSGGGNHKSNMNISKGGGSVSSGSATVIPGPISDTSCGGSEGYSSVSAATSSSCSASEPDPYAVPNTGRVSSSPDEGSILEANDSGIETPTRISEKDRMKIEYALMGRKTSIFVADCLANLYCMRKSNFLSSRPNSSLSNHTTGGGFLGQGGVESEWVLKYTGVPVLLLDLGETKSRDKRRIQIVLAELGSGLALWKDVIDNLSSYKVMEGSHTFHTMHLSTDHTKIIGLSFDDEECAEHFYQRVDKLTSDFANISLSGSKSKSKAKKEKSSAKTSKTKFIKPKKSEISQPCCFNHISSLTSNDKKRFPSLQNFVLGSSGPPSSASAAPNKTPLEQTSVSGASSHEDFVSMSPLAVAPPHGSDLHF